MVNVRVVNRPTGLYNGRPWPKEGETVALPDVIAQDMITAGQVELIQDMPAEETATPDLDQVETATPPKRKRGRPRKYPIQP